MEFVKLTDIEQHSKIDNVWQPLNSLMEKNTVHYIAGNGKLQR